MKAKRQKNGKWRCQLYITETLPDGTKKSVNRSFTANTRTEAEDLASEYRRTHARRSETLTVGDAIERYISSRDNVLSPSTVRSYRSMTRGVLKDILPEKTSEMTSEALQRWINRHTDRSTKTLKNAYALVVSSIRAQDPSYNVSVIFPARIRKETHVPTRDDVEALLALSDDENLYKAIL